MEPLGQAGARSHGSIAALLSVCLHEARLNVSSVQIVGSRIVDIENISGGAGLVDTTLLRVSSAKHA